MPGGRCARGLVCKMEWKAHTSIQVTPESPGIPHAMVYGLYRALPGVPGFLVTVACAPSRRLDTSVGVSGPHVFTVRKKAPSSEALLASTASCPALVTLANAPLGGTGRL
jgi:hypothetical protein